MITSAQNQQIKEIQALNQKHRERVKTGLFTAEGVKIISEAPKELIHKIFVSESFERNNHDLIKDFRYEVIADSLFEKICDTKTPQGILGILKQPVYKREELLGDGHTSPFILLLEDLQDPGNVGTIIRTAEGAGVTGIMLTKGCVDLFAPKTIRSTMGSIFRVPFICEDDTDDLVRWFKENQIQTYGAHLKGVCSYEEPSYREGTAFFIGNEGKGLSDALSDKCDTLIKIPMEGQLESLNAAVASAILMYKVHEQRK
jgi:TrmH family RNA methyltransferase